MKIIGGLVVLLGSVAMSIGCTIALLYGVVVMVVESFFGGLVIAIGGPVVMWLVGAVMIFVGSLMVEG